MLGHIHIRSEVFHIFIQNDTLTIHKAQRNTITGSIRPAIKCNMMILLQTSLFYLFQKIRFISFVEYGNTLLPGQIAKFISGEHFQIFVDRRDTKTPIVANPGFTPDSFLCRDFNNTGSTAGTILSCLGSIFENSETLYIGRINRSEHTEVTKYTIDNDQRVVTTGQ